MILFTLVISAFGFVAALFWNDAIKSTIDLFITPENTLLYKYVAAIIVTVIVAVVVYFLSKQQK